MTSCYLRPYYRLLGPNKCAVFWEKKTLSAKECAWRPFPRNNWDPQKIYWDIILEGASHWEIAPRDASGFLIWGARWGGRGGKGRWVGTFGWKGRWRWECTEKGVYGCMVVNILCEYGWVRGGKRGGGWFNSSMIPSHSLPPTSSFYTSFYHMS